MQTEEKYISRCLQLASYGRGFTAPNPMVGAVIVHQGKIIGEGFHRKYGGPHAEVNAIASVKEEQLLKESTLYVNLEPCSHYGKTPPCSELIIRKQIPRVVIGQIDPFPEVSGKGIKRLKEAGVEVVCGILEKECCALNKNYLTFIEEHRPYIILKWAQSADGFMDKFREEGDGRKPVRFSGSFTQMLVHKLRAEEAAIMIGRRTKLLDKPALNVRFWKGNDPERMVADSSKTLQNQLQELYAKNLQSLIVEGGSKLLHAFLAEDLWDETQIEISPVLLGEGVRAPVLLNGVLQNVQKCENSTIFLYKKPSKR
ncbi:MAG: bifunctional diaminohydroxyphosphoribosylaminopyrimidine deaminase/5-amino-6-(5-phosphoribosylamino)uracil reductase RibD [Dysgonamonadaceae bacterium]|jgi:diaminohydroxyphosphoribosylaminopyrimidine deaminase/5-amino-6-(5-phosphoribosylamino)uracil reductase|nr:bifunctional diaminohydroxyphosphoribosylaminopyrimidine deaminase/5-amino-6-(5-phosphoribosylamino)uracil reductase RibD [Dysgonamonadaceae bacterium]